MYTQDTADLVYFDAVSDDCWKWLVAPRASTPLFSIKLNGEDIYLTELAKQGLQLRYLYIKDGYWDQINLPVDALCATPHEILSSNLIAL